MIKFSVGLLRAVGVLRRPNNDMAWPPRSILISHPITTVGDVILILPLLEVIHKRWPEAEIDIATGVSMADLFACHPQVRNVFSYRPTNAKSFHLNSLLSILRLARLYRTELMPWNYDLAIVPRWDSDIHAFLARYLAYFTGAPERWSYSSTVDRGDTRVDSLLTKPLLGGAFEHEVHRFTGLIDRADGLRAGSGVSIDAPIEQLIEIANNNYANKKELLTGLTIGSNDNYAVIAPGASHPRRMWPAERLAELMKKLSESYGFDFLIIGTRADAAVCDWLAEQMPKKAVSLAGKTPILHTISLIMKASLFVGNDSGPGHIAGALGVPTVTVSSFPQSCKEDHANSPARFRPCGPKVKVVQPSTPSSPCASYCTMNSSHCITQITVNEVFVAIQQLLGSYIVETK
jgi:ADP-heptose:LPS heptosyltransferase